MSDRLYLMVKVIFLIVTAGLMTANLAMGCDNDPLVRRWVQEQDRAAVRMLQSWAAGASMDELAEDTAVIIGNTVYIQARCRDDVVFLKRTLLLFDAGPNLCIEVLPSIILEKKINRPGFFSTDSMFTEGR